MQTNQLLKQYKDKIVKLTDGMEIHKVSNFVIDVFTGNGWKNHTRLQRVQGKWTYVQGKHLNDALVNQAIQAL